MFPNANFGQWLFDDAFPTHMAGPDFFGRILAIFER